MYQSNPVGVESFFLCKHFRRALGLCYTFCAQKSRRETETTHFLL